MIFGEIYDEVNHTLTFYINAGAGLLGMLLILLEPLPKEDDESAPTCEDMEANVEEFKRQQDMPFEQTVMHEPVLVRSNSMALQRAESGRMSRTASTRLSRQGSRVSRQGTDTGGQVCRA
eukprot:UN4955